LVTLTVGGVLIKPWDGGDALAAISLARGGIGSASIGASGKMAER
jgi:hypothetical protein